MPEPAKTPKTPPKRILVVDDEPTVADMIRMVLAMWGHKVEIAADGRAALALFDPAKHDLVVTDYTMPGMNGLELAQAIRERSPAKPIIMITAHSNSITSDRRAHLDAVLGKPFQVQELEETLARLFSTPQV